MTNVETILNAMQTVDSFKDAFVAEVVTDNIAFLKASDYGDMPVTIVVNTQEVSFSSLLMPVPSDDREKMDSMNEGFLRLMGSKSMPLSTFSIVSEDGVDYYAIDGKLSSNSKPEVLVQEVNILVSNAAEIINEL